MRPRERARLRPVSVYVLLSWNSFNTLTERGLSSTRTPTPIEQWPVRQTIRLSDESQLRIVTTKKLPNKSPEQQGLANDSHERAAHGNIHQERKNKPEMSPDRSKPTDPDGKQVPRLKNGLLNHGGWPLVNIVAVTFLLAVVCGLVALLCKADISMAFAFNVRLSLNYGLQEKDDGTMYQRPGGVA